MRACSYSSTILAYAGSRHYTTFRRRSLFALIIALAFSGAAESVTQSDSPTTSSIATREACNGKDFQMVLSPSEPSDAQREVRAIWLNRRLIKWPGAVASEKVRLYHSTTARIEAESGSAVRGADGWLTLDDFAGEVPVDIARRFKYVAAGRLLSVREVDLKRLPGLLKGQLVLVNEDATGKTIDATALQSAGVLDDLFAGAALANDLGVSVSAANTRFRIWAPTAQQVSLCMYDSGTGRSGRALAMQSDKETGVWSRDVPADWSGKYYTYLVDVYVPGSGIVRNRVTDPYSISLATDSTRSYIASLKSTLLKPRGWNSSRVPARVKVRASTDMVIYELHVRDFSINDPTVPMAHRGKYTAFTQTASNGMKQLDALSKAGMTDVHLLPVFDFATVPESGCAAPTISETALSPESEVQQAAVMAVKDADCFNWGYDPLHYTAPEGSYASSAADGARRIIEFRQMVMALHGIGLRVGMDVVYNHTSASGQHEKSVLDRIVPGYYHRLNNVGKVEKSTCCDNTSTENLMMAKLMLDSVITWAREYKIDSFRFDLMGHQPRAVMLDMQRELKRAIGRDIHLIGEGWNFGEVADGARFVQASQLSLNGTGIGTFNDRLRDAVRGGGAADNGEQMIKRQGYINGLHYEVNALANADTGATDLLRTADMVRVGLAGSVRGYLLKTYRDEVVPLQKIDYGGQAAGYASEPSEVVNYIENHDNQTLFDINAYKLPISTRREDRARVQVLGLAINVFSQGAAYFHAGVELLRSKSLDRNSYDSGDWFNRLDWSYRENYFGTGAPPKSDNGSDYALIKPLLANADIKPTPSEILWTRNAFLDLLRIRASTTLFRLRTANDIASRLTFFNTGSGQIPTLQVGHLDGEGYAGAQFRELTYLVNVDKNAVTISAPAMSGKKYILHPAHTSPSAADTRIIAEARFDPVTATFNVPPRSAVVFVVK